MEKQRIHKICDKGHEWLDDEEDSTFCFKCWGNNRYKETMRLKKEFLDNYPNCYSLANIIFPQDRQPLYGLLKEVQTYLRPVKEDEIHTS
jgi:hypothetical protein